MGFSTPSSTKKQSVSGTGLTTDVIDTTGADLIAVFLEWYGSTGAQNDLSDNAGNLTASWISLPIIGTGTRNGRWIYKFSPSTSASHQFTASESSSTFPSMYVLSFPSDGTPTFNAVISALSSGSVTSLQPGSQSFNELFVVGLVLDGTVTGVSIDSSFATFDAFPSETSGLAGGISYKIRTTLSSENPIISWTGSQVATASMATFTSGGSGASSGEGTGWPKIFKSPRKSGLP